MKRTYSIGLSLTAIMLAAAASMAGADEAAAKTYAAKCASCHAKDGKGNPAMAKMFKVEPAKLSLVGEETANKTDADLIKITTEGLNKMPAYKGKLKETEIADVIAYTRTLKAEKK